MTIAAVILAAGYGTRMHSSLPKVLHPFLGRPMIEWALAAVQPVADLPPVVVVGHGKEEVQTLLGDRVRYAEQAQLLGTGHAVQGGTSLQGQADAVMVTYGDTPLLRSETLAALAALYDQQRPICNPAVALLTVTRDDPQGFGRIVRDAEGAVCGIVEEVDCTPEQKAIRELNPGIYCFDADWLWANLPDLPLSAKGEYYLTDLVGMAVAQGRAVVAAPAPVDEVNGINRAFTGARHCRPAPAYTRAPYVGGCHHSRPGEHVYRGYRRDRYGYDDIPRHVFARQDTHRRALPDWSLQSHHRL